MRYILKVIISLYNQYVFQNKDWIVPFLEKYGNLVILIFFHIIKFIVVPIVWLYYFIVYIDLVIRSLIKTIKQLGFKGFIEKIKKEGIFRERKRKRKNK